MIVLSALAMGAIMPKLAPRDHIHCHLEGRALLPLNDFIAGLRHRCVRDLAWACFSPSLIARFPGTEATDYSVPFDQSARRWLRFLDDDPAPLLDHLHQRHSTRLGLYFESLWRFYWQAQSHQALLLHNDQVLSSGKTLGAFDFVIDDADERYRHIECAVKFYLALPGKSDRTDGWLGPNANDRLDIKLERMRSHQLTLSQSPAGREKLAQAGARPDALSRHYLLRGYLFYAGVGDTPALPIGAPTTGTGYWWHSHQLGVCIDSIPGPYAVIPRNHWLAPQRLAGAVQPLSSTGLERVVRRAVTNEGRTLMFAALERRGGLWHERERFFVVPDQWPASARPPRKT